MLRLLILIPFLALWSCNRRSFDGNRSQTLKPPAESQLTRGKKSSGNLENKERPSEDTGGIPGYTLTCNNQNQPTNQSPEMKIDCGIATNDGNVSQLNSIATQWEWSFDGITDTRIGIVVEENDDEVSEVLASYTIKGPNPGAVISANSGFYAVLKITLIGSSSQTVLREEKPRRDNSSESTVEKPQFQFYRIVFESVRNAGEFNEMSIETLQVRIAGAWFEGFFESDHGHIGPYPAIVSASSIYGPGFEAFHAFLGKEINYSWSTEENSFSPEIPYNFSQSPSWLQIEFETAVILDGLGIDGGDVYYGNLTELASPSSFYVQGSSDGAQWQKIDASEHVSINTSNFALYSW